MKIARREFLNSLFATAAMPAFASPLALMPSGKPNLVLGIISDVHISSYRRDGVLMFHGKNKFKQTLEWFKAQGVDAVAICGDMADFGLVEELVALGDVWNEVFGGTKTEKLFVYGNHDWEGVHYGRHTKKIFGQKFFEHSIKKDLGAAWRKAFGEDWSPVWRKDVKGYTFVGAHWITDRCRGREERGVPQAAAWFNKNAKSIDPSKPFFYLQHPPLKNTNLGPWHWGHDQGKMTSLFAASFPNAIALSGHSHASLSDERTIWRGAFTSINASSLKYTGLQYDDLAPIWRENDQASKDPDRHLRVMNRIYTRDGHHGLLARVYGDRIVFERRDFKDMGLLGNDWVLPLDGGPIMRNVSVPAFPSNAKLGVRLAKGKNRGGGKVKRVMQDVLEIVIPAATGVKGGRILDYSIEFKDVNGKREERAVFAEAFYRSRATKKTVCRIGLNTLKVAGKISITVAPRNSLGTAGAPLTAKFDLDKRTI